MAPKFDMDGFACLYLDATSYPIAGWLSVKSNGKIVAYNHLSLGKTARWVIACISYPLA